jgi:D-alanine-D-alanine ligase-like ATP-grasp enzyme
VFDQDSKYHGSAQLVLPAPISEEEHASLQDAAKRMFDAVGVSYPELLDQLISSALHNQR